MVDCGKTVIFLSEWKRMCSTQPIDPMCGCCPLKVELAQKFNCKQCFAIIRQYPDEAQRIVQRWSDEHPLPKQKTYADDFFEKYPNAKRHENGRPLVYRCDVYGCECNYKKSPEVIYWRGKQGIDDCLTCWNEPYQE